MEASMVILRSGAIITGSLEYYLDGLECWEDFDIALNEFKQLGAKILDTLDGIYSRIANIEKDGITFKIIYHEDVGLYAYIVSHPSQQSNDRLKQILEQVVSGINTQLNS
jgi:hypothetical protein